MMPKFRSMRVDTPEVASDKLGDTGEYITPFGAFLRRTSLDELPQIYSVLRGDMSIVGQRYSYHRAKLNISAVIHQGLCDVRKHRTV